MGGGSEGNDLLMNKKSGNSSQVHQITLNNMKGMHAHQNSMLKT
jgi:hypothetical protein